MYTPCSSYLHRDRKEDRHTLGRVGEVLPPRIVIPLSIEPSKPRLVLDQQYLNCLMKHYPFKLDQVLNLPRYLGKESYHTKLDDKSGFDHFLLSEDSRTLVGAEWGGWWLVWNTLCQGWKEILTSIRPSGPSPPLRFESLPHCILMIDISANYGGPSPGPALVTKPHWQP